MMNRQIPKTIIGACLIVILAGCAHIEAPVHDFTAEKWSSQTLSQPTYEWEVTAPDTIEVLIVETGPRYGTFGHAGIHVGGYAYSWDYGGGYVLVKKTFRDFLKCYTKKHNRSVTGIVVSYPEEAIVRLVSNLNEEYRQTWSENYNRGSFFLVNNCSTLVFKELIKASGIKPKGWPPILIPDWMGKNIERTFPLLHYNLYRKADPSKEGA